jgi:hypothetical protein
MSTPPDPHNTNATPPNLSDLARLLGKKGGSAKSARKTAAARANGQKNAERVRALRATRPTPEAPGNSTP